MKYNGFYLMDDTSTKYGFSIIGITYPEGNEALIDISSISDDFISFTAETKSMYNCGTRVCRRYESLAAAYFGYLQAVVKGVV